MHGATREISPALERFFFLFLATHRLHANLDRIPFTKLNFESDSKVINLPTKLQLWRVCTVYCPFLVIFGIIDFSAYSANYRASHIGYHLVEFSI